MEPNDKIPNRCQATTECDKMIRLATPDCRIQADKISSELKASNPGYWFLHCHIEVHQLEGMAVVINEAKDRHNLPPSNMLQSGALTWEPDDFI